MRKKLLALLKKKEERKKALGKQAESTESVEELRSINAELETLNGEIAEMRSMVDELPDDDEQDPVPDERGGDPEQRNQPGATNVIATYGVGPSNQRQQQSRSTDDQFDSPEYRSAFMDYVQRGVRSETLEFRADATTGVGDVGAVIPTTILNKIVEKMKDNGRIFAKITQTSIKGGVEIPISDLKPVATWVASNAMSDKQKKQVTGKISFSYHKLQCRVAVDLVAGTVSMPVFEQTVVDNIYEAMIIAIEEAVLSGTGTGQPLGITVDPAVTNIVDVSVADMAKYDTWTKLFGKVPRKYRGGVNLILADEDWTKYIEGMTDANGQPIGRVTYGIDGSQQEKLLGKDVLAVEDYLPSIDTAATGDIFGVICKLSDYTLNSNMQMLFKRYFNEDTDEWINKATLIGDGKLADRNGVVLLRKAATV